MNNNTINEWLKYAPTAPNLPVGKKWHVFLSYRSVHRPWVLSFYDILIGLGYKVFVDQFVLRSNDNLTLALQSALDDSMSGILIWSSKTKDSEWCQKEFTTMDKKATEGGFHYGVAKLDNVILPSFASQKLYADFSNYSDGPQGSGLLRLLYGIVNKPLSNEAIRFGSKVDEDIRSFTHQINSSRDSGNIVNLIELSKNTSVAWKSTPVLGCEVAESLLKLENYDKAIDVINRLILTFPKAVRPKQLKGLALARKGETEEAQQILGELEAEGNRDPETLGILARTWMDRYNKTGKINFLRKSRNLYQLAFEHTPSDYYVGINAAAKSVLLGETELADKIAIDLEQIVGTEAHEGNYWETATTAEVQLIRKKFKEAAKLYQAAVDIAPLETGSHKTTWKQARLLLNHLKASDEDIKRIETVFSDISL